MKTKIRVNKSEKLGALFIIIGLAMIIILSWLSIDMTPGRALMNYFLWWCICIIILVGGISIQNKSKKKPTKSHSITTTIKLTDHKYVKNILRDFAKLIKLCLKENIQTKSRTFAVKMKKKYSKELGEHKNSGSCSDCRYGPQRCGWLCSDGDLWELKEETE